MNEINDIITYVDTVYFPWCDSYDSAIYHYLYTTLVGLKFGMKGKISVFMEKNNNREYRVYVKEVF